MVAIQINGKIKQFSSIPKSWKNVICGYDTLSSDVWEEAGFYNVVTPSYDSAIQKLGDIEWDSDNNVFTYPVVSLTWSQTVAEMKTSKIETLKSIYGNKLSNTDWYIIRAQEGTAAPQDIIDARAALRTECATKEDEINALTTKSAIASYSLPSFI